MKAWNEEGLGPAKDQNGGCQRMARGEVNKVGRVRVWGVESFSEWF